MGQPKEARLTSEMAQQICERTASAAVLEGSIARVGSQYVLGLRAKNCNTGNILDQEQAVAARREDVLNSLSQIARKFRTRVGESLATVEKHDTPLVEATTPSLEALKAYTAGRKAHGSIGAAASLPLLKRAIEIDPKFAAVYVFLGHVYGEMGESDLSAENVAKAYQFRDRASDSGWRDSWSMTPRGPSPAKRVTVDAPAANPRLTDRGSQGEPSSSSAKQKLYLPGLPRVARSTRAHVPRAVTTISPGRTAA